MFRKLICFASVIVVLALSSSVWAVAYTWDDGNSVDHYWGSPNNWDPNGVPVFGDDVSIGSGLPEANQPVIPVGCDANAGTNADSFSIIGTLDDAALTVESGGSLTLLPFPDDGGSPILMLGSGWVDGGNGILNVAGDVFTRRVWVGYNSQAVTNGSGWINMTGGTFIASTDGDGEGGFEIARGDDCMGGMVTPGNGYVHLDGGVIDIQGFFTMRRGYPACGDDPSEEWPTSNGYLDITGGTMMIQYDARDTIQHYIDEGWITAYGIGSMEDATIASDPRAEIVMDYDWRNTEKTTVTAFKPANNGEPYKLYPPQYAAGVDPTVTLSWSPGDYIGTGGVPGSKTGNGHHVFIGTLEAQSGNMEGWNLQYPVGTLYGHIVGAQDATILDITASYPGGSLELDTEYVWTVVEANDANGIPSGGATRDISWWKPQVVYHFRTVGGAASNPSPGDGATVGIKVGAALSYELTWDRGYYAASTNSHQIYFGTDFNDVNEANTLDLEYIITKTDPNYTATDLELGKEYFWRVDEVNPAGPDPCIWPGDTWSFTVGDYRVVDDFDYASSGEMDDFWKINAFDLDYTLPCSTMGGGASLGLAGGAMSYSYDNNDIYDPLIPGFLDLDFFSEVRYEFPAPADLTEGDSETTLRALALDHRGTAGNAADPNYDRMYVALESADGNMAIVSNLDVSAQKKPSSQFNIDLRDFSDAGVNVQDVVYLYIGFGIQCNPNPGTPGGEGVVNFDNIRVYPPRCVGQPGGMPYYRQLGDLNGDCTVDIKDMKSLSNAWLMTDRLTGVPVAVADDDPCMMARWEFEGNWDNDPKARIKADSNGIPHGEPEFVVDGNRPQSLAGNQVAYFDQDLDTVDGNDYVICGTWGGPDGDANFLGKSYTLSVWAKQTEPNGWACMISKGEAAEKLEFGFTPYLQQQVHFVGHGGNAAEKMVPLNEWHYLVGTWEEWPDVNGGMSRVYIDGRLESEEDMNEIAYEHSRNPDYDPSWCIGAQDFEGLEDDVPPYRPHIDRVYYGYLDDVRVYDRRLSEEEIMWLAGKRAPSKNYYAILPPASYADTYSPEPKGQKIINFKDMAKMAQEWLESALWPVIP